MASKSGHDHCKSELIDLHVTAGNHVFRMQSSGFALGLAAVYDVWHPKP